jgi:hypothetical protein
VAPSALIAWSAAVFSWMALVSSSSTVSIMVVSGSGWLSRNAAT